MSPERLVLSGIQRWESNPLGPFRGKSFATIISPWLVTTEALRPFAIAPSVREPDDPTPLSYLRDEVDNQSGAYSIILEAWIETERMRKSAVGPQRIVETSATNFYWTIAQMLAHFSSNGCRLEPGDLIATGTCSGKEETSAACLAESLVARTLFRLPMERSGCG